MYTKLAQLEKTIGKTMQGFHKTISVLERTTTEYEELKVQLQREQAEFNVQVQEKQESLSATEVHLNGKITATNNLLKNFKGLLGI